MYSANKTKISLERNKRKSDHYITSVFKYSK